MKQPRSRSRRPLLPALLALGPLAALAVALTVAVPAEAAPRCTYKPAACKLEQDRAERRQASSSTTATSAASKPDRVQLLCSSKTAACDQQKKAEARAAARAAAAPPREKVVTTSTCNLKPAACWLEERRAAN